MTAAMPIWRHVYRWDLDKTYLATDFEKLSRMVRIAMEGPEDKRNVPGSAALLRELTEDRESEAAARVCIVSGSPRQMRRVLEQKLRADGITWHEFELKPQWKNLRRGRFRAIRDQVGYKLPLLLQSRTRVRPSVRETLFGDDAEADTFIYALYADVVAGRVDPATLVKILKSTSAYPDAIDRCLAAVEKLEPSDAVERIFIHLDKRTSPAWFAPFGAIVVPVFNYFQAALVLFSEGHLDVAGVLSVTRAFREADEHDPEELGNLFQDIQRRGHLATGAMQRLAEALRERGEPGEDSEVLVCCEDRHLARGPGARPSEPAPPVERDWMHLVTHQRRRS
ncbi:MAG: phosphatase domain-containing protein [Myxococcota bacterium]|nr:phosphatase domain-containing protein [Myxococcota bacterium]